MSCFNLRFPPAKKAWRSFTSKLQTKLHKIHKSKAVKKPRDHKSKATKKWTNQLHKSKAIEPSVFLKQGLRADTSFLHRTLRLPYKRNYIFKKKTGPVYIDKLFKEPVVELVKHTQVCQSREKSVKLLGHRAAKQPGTSKQEGARTADDMWESLGLTPQMHGIDERAEEFIAKFRAEMQLQEMMASHL